MDKPSFALRIGGRPRLAHRIFHRFPDLILNLLTLLPNIPARRGALICRCNGLTWRRANLAYRRSQLPFCHQSDHRHHDQ